MSLTTPDKVRERLSIEEYQASDAIVNDFISSAEGEIEYRLGRTPVATDPDWDFACAIATGLAAIQTGLMLPYPESDNEARAWSYKLKMIRGKTSADMVHLTSDLYPAVPLPRSTTGD
jgi:hypothetical protein